MAGQIKKRKKIAAEWQIAMKENQDFWNYVC